MKTLFIVLLFSLFLLTSCVQHFPAEDIHFLYPTSRGPVGLGMPKGYLNEENKGKTWHPAKECPAKKRSREGSI